MRLKQECIGNVASWFGAVANRGPMLVRTDVEELSRSGMASGQRRRKLSVCVVFEQKQQLRHAFKMKNWIICF